MANSYGKMMDEAFGKYYERFRELNALSKETAVTIDELFPNGQDYIDADRMHKMLSSDIVKRVGLNKYWLDEARAANPNAVLRQRIMILVIAFAAAMVILALKKFGILNI